MRSMTWSGPVPDTVWKSPADPENVLQAFQKCEADLKDANIDDKEKAKRLCWIEHLVGDVHQPLHSTALFSKMFPKGDHGGNYFGVTETKTKADGTKELVPHKLHTYWDDLLGESDSEVEIMKKAESLLAKPDLTRAKLQGDLKHATYAEWAQESVALAKATAYDNLKLKGQHLKENEDPTKDAPTLPPGYRANAVKVAEKQVMLAGYRLADKLNAQFKAPG